MTASVQGLVDLRHLLAAYVTSEADLAAVRDWLARWQWGLPPAGVTLADRADEALYWLDTGRLGPRGGAILRQWLAHILET